MEIDKFKEMIRFALEKEKEAVDFYKECSRITERKEMKEVFSEMADEEKKHVRMLENFKPEHVEKINLKEIPDLKISDYLVDVQFDPSMSYRDLLILAMKREEKSNILYTELAREGGDPSVVKLFQILAQEELKHKNRIQKEYDDMMLQGN